jgi:predicted nucleotidyltransferase component of viral defense system
MWASENGVSIAEARVRFAQFGVLHAIASVRPLREALVFKGGNALDFVWQPNRSTADLDFSLDASSDVLSASPELLGRLVERGLNEVAPFVRTAFVLQGMRQKPPGESRTFATYEARIGYALPDQEHLRARLQSNQPSPQIVRVEMSVNDPICDSTTFHVENGLHLRICTLEDIVAEKLRALLQQPIRNRTRRQDLLDIAVILKEGHAPDRAKVAAYLLTKAAAREVSVSRGAFRNPEIASRARQGYEDLAMTTRVRFIPFEEAWTALIAFVDELAIPENA